MHSHTENLQKAYGITNPSRMAFYHTLPGSYDMQLSLIAVVLFAVAVIIRFRSRARNGKTQTTTQPPYLLHFPPSRRHALTGFNLPAVKKSVPKLEIPPMTLHAHALPTTRAQDLSINNQYTPTGFSTQEIRALGRFPDYSTLSGVRDPRPYGAHFDIAKARFRPFRPFRWGYHQTMCKMTSQTQSDSWRFDRKEV